MTSGVSWEGGREKDMAQPPVWEPLGIQLRIAGAGLLVANGATSNPTGVTQAYFTCLCWTPLALELSLPITLMCSRPRSPCTFHLSPQKKLSQGNGHGGNGEMKRQQHRKQKHSPSH